MTQRRLRQRDLVALHRAGRHRRAGPLPLQPAGVRRGARRRGSAPAPRGKDLLVALAAGCEMMERASQAANPSLRNRGFHTTPERRRVRRDRRRRQAAEASIPTSWSRRSAWPGAQSAGPDGDVRPVDAEALQPGPAARNGVTSALMAKLGFTGTALIFEGERGWLNAFSDKRTAARARRGPRRRVPARHRVQAVLVRAPDPQRHRLRAGDPQAARLRCGEGDSRSTSSAIRTGRSTTATRRPPPTTRRRCRCRSRWRSRCSRARRCSSSTPTATSATRR